MKEEWGGGKVRNSVAAIYQSRPIYDRKRLIMLSIIKRYVDVKLLYS